MTATPRAPIRELAAGRWAAACFMSEGFFMMLLGLATALAPRFGDLAPGLVFGWTMMVGGIAAAAGLPVLRDHAHPAWRSLGAAAAVAAGALALAGPFAVPSAFPALVATYLAVDALALCGLALRLRRRAPSGWEWLVSLACFDLVLASWLVALQAQLSAAAVGYAVAARFIIGGMTLVGLGATALDMQQAG